MLNQPTTIVLIQYASQAALALIVMLLLNRFYKSYQNKYFHYWSWSWLGLMIYMVGAGISLLNAIQLPLDHPFRILMSILTVAAGLFHAVWLLLGSIELVNQKEFSKKLVLIVSIAILPVAVALVLPFMSEEGAGAVRILLRVGIKSLLASAVFIYSSVLIFKVRSTGIGAKFILFSFLLYGLEQLNYFSSYFYAVFDFNYILQVPYYLGILDLLLQALMGMGMIISVLELEQVRLKKANNELDTFLYRSSHDLRAPITTIQGLVNAIRRDPNESDRFIDLIENRVSQADKVIRDIIDLRKGQKVGLKLALVNPKDLILSVYEMLSSPELAHIEFKVECKIKTIYTDREKLETILLNLLSNAIKYRDTKKEGPFINVRVFSANKGFLIDVSDNGLGIEEEYLPRIFDMFYRASETSQGSGLGLYLTKEAVLQLGGNISVVSERGEGTTFSIYFKGLD